ncbi:MAG: polymerase subunit sigma-24 [Frankiales bacterium]|nr:polymerase subunit sigma-24 [Frankiales bacterium]
MESSTLIAALARLVRDVGLAEDFAQDALVAALAQWPEEGVPTNPGAWLMTVAKRRAADHFRRRERLDRKHSLLRRDLETTQGAFLPDFDAALDDPIEDDRLRLMFICCHPLLSTDAQTALTLRLLGGLTTPEIARGFLTTEATIAQRIVRAKRTLGAAKVPFELPGRHERAERLASVLGVLYLVFNEGYSATAGQDWMRPALCDEALRLGRMLAALAPDEPEVHGLVALMEIQASRASARRGPAGEPVLLLDQNREDWDQLLIRRGLNALDLAGSLPGQPGPYVLQAEIAACHARARTADATDWGRIVSLYDSLVALEPSPVVELNRAVAVGMAQGPAAALTIVDALTSRGALARYHLLPSVRGDLLSRLGRREEARQSFELAASITQNDSERTLLLNRAATCA